MGRHTPDNTDAAAQEADDYVSEHGTGYVLPHYEIFGTSTCPYCDKAKELLTSKGLNFTFKNIDEDDEAFDQLVGRIKSWKTVPQIFYGATHIGGFQELEQSLSNYFEFHKTGEFSSYIGFAEPPKPSFVFSLDGPKWIMKITPEGKLEFGEGLSPEEGAQKAAKLLLDFWNQQRGLARTDELIEANNRYLLRARASEILLGKVMERTLEPLNEEAEQTLNEIEQHLLAPWR